MKVCGRRLRTVAVLMFLAACAAFGAVAEDLAHVDYTFTSTLDSTGPLKARAVFMPGAAAAPIMIVQHGYNGNLDNVLYSAGRMARRGYFCLCIDTRGWGGSAGKHDDGGLEIMDIQDGLQEAVRKFGAKVDASRVSIIGYSNGGANVYFSAVRCPFTYRSSLALFGIPDYGQWIRLQDAFRTSVIAAVGGKPEEVPDKYMVRSATLAAGNLSGVRFHIAHDEAETLCPIAMPDAFVKACQGNRNVFVHMSRKSDRQRWLHGYNTSGHLSGIEDMFMDDIDKVRPEAPVMPASGELVALGFLVTPKFTCVLGSGEDSAARVWYEFKDGHAELRFKVLTSVPKVRVRIIVPRGVMGDVLEAGLKGGASSQVKAGEAWTGEVSTGTVLQLKSIETSKAPSEPAKKPEEKAKEELKPGPVPPKSADEKKTPAVESY
jgi:pimeloyl-ACP methyl ester carboxylesterase